MYLRVISVKFLLLTIFSSVCPHILSSKPELCNWTAGFLEQEMKVEFFYNFLNCFLDAELHPVLQNRVINSKGLSGLISNPLMSWEQVEGFFPLTFEK